MNDHVHPIFQSLLREPREVLAKHSGKVHPADRTGSVIVAAIKSASLTVNEMGNILEAITGRISDCSNGNYPQYPELEETSADLAETCEAFTAAQNKIDERLHEQNAWHDGYQEEEEHG